MAKKSKGTPRFESKQPTQYSREGVNLRDLIASQVGGSDDASFQDFLGSAGLSRRDRRRLTKAYDTIRSSGKDYILSEDGTGFNVFDQETGAAETRSGRNTGNTKGVNLADLINLGDNVSRLAGFAAQNMKPKSLPVTMPKEQPLPATSDSQVNNTGDPMIDLQDYQVPSAPAKAPASSSGKTTTKAQTNAKGPQPDKDSEHPFAGVVNQRFEEARAKMAAQRQPYIDEARLAEHLKGVREQFEKRLVGMGGFTGFAMGPGSVSSNSIRANTKAYTDRAAAIYEAMVREGYEPDIEEISSLIQNDELEQISGGLSTNLNTIGTVMTLGRLGPFMLRGGAGGLKSLASKYPKFAKWLASKGVAKPLQFPQTQTLPSVSRGAKDFLRERARTGAASKAMRYESGFGKGGKIVIQDSIDAAAQKVDNFQGSPVKGVFSLKSLMGTK